MPVPEAEQYLPVEEGVLNAYKIANAKHAFVNSVEVIARLSDERLSTLIDDYLMTGIAYLANRGNDDYLQEVGTTAWFAITQGLTAVAYAEDPAKRAKLMLNIPKSQIITFDPHEPIVGHRIRKNGPQIKDYPIALIPPELVINAKENPVAALASTVAVASHIRDAVNNRILIDAGVVQQRAHAIEAHFLLGVREVVPDLQLNPFLKKLIRNFPNGMQSLPRRVMYRVPHRTGSTRPDLN